MWITVIVIVPIARDPFLIVTDNWPNNSYRYSNYSMPVVVTILKTINTKPTTPIITSCSCASPDIKQPILVIIVPMPVQNVFDLNIDFVIENI